MPPRPETQTAYVQGQVDRVRAIFPGAKGADRISVKRIERKLLGLENKIKSRTDLGCDAGVCFEDTGIDHVIVEEMNMHKNLATDSNIRNAAIECSERSSDLHMKLEYPRSQGRDRVVTGATATPISNSVAEAFLLQR